MLCLEKALIKSTSPLAFRLDRIRPNLNAQQGGRSSMHLLRCAAGQWNHYWLHIASCLCTLEHAQRACGIDQRFINHPSLLSTTLVAVFRGRCTVALSWLLASFLRS